MPTIEKWLTSAFAFGIIAYLIGLRVYALYAGVRESQRGDREVGSGVQTLFQDGEVEPEPEDSGIQTLFSSKDTSE